MWYLIGMYLASIVTANLLVATFGAVVTIPCAFFFVALDLTAGDRLHETWHHNGLLWKSALLIASGSLISYALNTSADRIALASFVAFLASASADRIIYALLGSRSYLVKVNGSNVVSAAIDSIIFPALAFGGFPILIIVGQFLAKTIGGALWAWLLRPKDQPKSPQHAA